MAVSAATSVLKHGRWSREGKTANCCCIMTAKRVSCNPCLVTGKNVIKRTETPFCRWKSSLVLLVRLFVLPVFLEALKLIYLECEKIEVSPITALFYQT